MERGSRNEGGFQKWRGFPRTRGGASRISKMHLTRVQINHFFFSILNKKNFIRSFLFCQVQICYIENNTVCFTQQKQKFKSSSEKNQI